MPRGATGTGWTPPTRRLAPSGETTSTENAAGRAVWFWTRKRTRLAISPPGSSVNGAPVARATSTS